MKLIINNYAHLIMKFMMHDDNENENGNDNVHGNNDNDNYKNRGTTTND